jgi:hypothetical protein
MAMQDAVIGGRSLVGVECVAEGLIGSFVYAEMDRHGAARWPARFTEVGGMRAIGYSVSRMVARWSMVLGRLVIGDIARNRGLWHQNLNFRFGIVPNVMKGKR